MKRKKVDANSLKLDQTKTKLLDEYCKGETILDLGAGFGKYSHYLNIKGKQVTAIDKQLHNTRDGSIQFLQADACSIPLKAKSVDTTVCFDVLEHLRETALAEVIRVTRKRIIATLPRTTDKCLRDNWLLFGHHQARNHQRTYSMPDVKNLLTENHLTEMLITPSHPISTENLFLAILDGRKLVKKIIRKLVYIALKPKKFYTNI